MDQKAVDACPSCPITALAAALDANPNGVLLTDRAHMVRHANPAAETVTGLTIDQLIGREPDFLTEGFTAKSELAAMWVHLEGGCRWDSEWLVKRPGGGFYWCAVAASPLHDETGSLSGYAIYLEDISDRKAAENQLIASESRHRSLIEAAGMAVLLVGRDGEIQHVNQELERILQYRRNELRGHDFINMLIPERARAHTRGLLDALLDGHEMRNMESAAMAKDGREVILLWNAAPLKSGDGTVTGIVATGQNITERKRAEAQLLIAKEQAERASAAKSEFLAAMSHELRTPLNAIIGNADLIMNQVLGPAPDDYVDCAGDIHESGHHLMTVISDILDMAKIEAGKMVLNEEVCDVAELIQAAVRITGDPAETADVAVNLDLAEPSPKILADAAKLRQIIINLLSNAVKFTPAGGSVTVSSRIDESGSMCIDVVDTGIGMAAEDIPTALEKFGQVAHDGTLKPPGTGLGLPLVQSLCDLHKAEFQLNSHPGEGTRATVILPPERLDAED